MIGGIRELSSPTRLQLSRRKGFDLQALSQATNGLPAVNVARPSRWGNPFNWKDWLDDAKAFPHDLPFAEDRETWCKTQAADEHYSWLHGRGEPGDPIPPTLSEIMALRGKNLACWCAAYEVCHANNLLELANSPICEAIEGSGRNLADAHQNPPDEAEHNEP